MKASSDDNIHDIDECVSREDSLQAKTLPLESSTITSFSAINGSVLHDNHLSTVVPSTLTEDNDATFEATLSEMPPTPLDAQYGIEQTKRNSGDTAASPVLSSAIKIARDNSSRNRSDNEQRSTKAKGPLHDTDSRSTYIDVVTSKNHGGDDRNRHDSPTRRDNSHWKMTGIPGSLHSHSYEGLSMNEAGDHSSSRSGKADDPLLALPSDTSTSPRDLASQDSYNYKYGTSSGPKYGYLRNSKASETTEAVSISETFGMHTAATEQKSASSYMHPQDRAIARRDEQVLVRPSIDQASAKEDHEDIGYPSSTVKSESNRVQLAQRYIQTLAFTTEAHLQEINNLRNPDHKSATQLNGAANIESRKRRASQELIDRTTGVNKFARTHTRLTTKPLEPLSSEPLEVTAGARCGSPTQIREGVPKTSLPSLAIAPAPGITISARDKHRVKPEIFVKDSQALWTKWPYGSLRDCTIDILFARLAKAYELPPAQVWAVQFTFPDAKDQTSLIVSREKPDSFELLHKQIWEVGKTFKAKGAFQIYADPHIDPDAESEVELEAY
ncbi:hypothetical protein MMC18_008110 [Xylographa bjoerkii]|nr:hypothetical protein [Xylographa bjoerkii]